MKTTGRNLGLFACYFRAKHHKKTEKLTSSHVNICPKMDKNKYFSWPKINSVVCHLFRKSIFKSFARLADFVGIFKRLHSFVYCSYPKSQLRRPAKLDTEFRNIASSVGFKWPWHIPASGRLHCHSYTGFKIDMSLATTQINNSFPCLCHVHYNQILGLPMQRVLYSLVQTTFPLVPSMLTMGQLCCWGFSKYGASIK